MSSPRLLALAAVAVALVVWGIMDLDPVRQWSSYGDFDVPARHSGVYYLAPGIPDLAAEKVYSFERVVTHPLVAMGVLFVVMLALRLVRDPDLRLRSRRWLAQWLTFVFSRLGVLRVAGVWPVQRCTAGVFPFLNCHACEMATGACPVGTLQLSLANLRFPSLTLGTILAAGLSTGAMACGWLCPMGMICDIVDKVSLRRLRIPAAAGAARLVILAAVVLLCLGYGLWGHTDPRLNYCSTLCPAGQVLGLAPYYLTTGLPGIEALFAQPAQHSTGLIILGLHGLALVAMVALTLLTFGRAFCRYLCPLGAALGLFNTHALVQVVHRPAACTGGDCRLCTEECPVQIDLRQRSLLVQSACIRCGRCVKACPAGARAWTVGRTEGLKLQQREDKT